MRATPLHWTVLDGWQGDTPRAAGSQLVLYFGSRPMLADGDRYNDLRRMFPHANIVGCSTGGQIIAHDVGDDTVAALAIAFRTTRVAVVQRRVEAASDSYDCGVTIGKSLAMPHLAGVFVLSDGLSINGSALVEGVVSQIGQNVPLTGGLAGDGTDFGETLVGANRVPEANMVSAIGLYGSELVIGHGSAGGWDVFGPRRKISRAEGRVLYELDGSPALDLYELYLGPEEAKGLPSTALLFPLRICDPAKPGQEVVRTVHSIDRDTGSLTFAGDVPEGWSAQLMRGQFDRLIAGAAEAARAARVERDTGFHGDRAAILVSCVGRRLLMGQRIGDEIEAAGEELGVDTRQLGFYSYGEISPHAVSGCCQLHNQTMTVTTLQEVA